MQDLGRILVVVGVVLVLLGLLLYYSGPLSFLRIGCLPGDISIKRDGFRLYVPLTTSVLASIVLTVVLYFLRK